MEDGLLVKYGRGLRLYHNTETLLQNEIAKIPLLAGIFANFN